MDEEIIQSMINMSANTLHELCNLYKVVGIHLTAATPPGVAPDDIMGVAEFMLPPKKAKEIFASKDAEIFDFARRFGAEIEWHPYDATEEGLAVIITCSSEFVTVEQIVQEIPNVKTLCTLIRLGTDKTKAQQN